MNALTAARDQPEDIRDLPTAAGRACSPKPRVLVADDDAGVRESLGKLLRGVGFQVTLAAHGGQVLELVLNGQWDLLLLDLNMPEMDGWEALNHVQRFRPELPVVVITAQPGQHDWVREAGARALLEKPLDLLLLLSTARSLVRPLTSDTSSPPPGAIQ